MTVQKTALKLRNQHPTFRVKLRLCMSDYFSSVEGNNFLKRNKKVKFDARNWNLMESLRT